MELKYQQENAASRLHHIDSDALGSNVLRQARRGEAGQGGAQWCEWSKIYNRLNYILLLIMDDTPPSTLLRPSFLHSIHSTNSWNRNVMWCVSNCCLSTEIARAA